MTYQVKCADCGSVSEEYGTKKFAEYMLRMHDCERACPECRFRRVPLNESKTRGLCRSCYDDKQIRIRYALPENRGLATLREIEFLAEQGCGIVEVARRLGMQAESVRRALSRADKMDLYWVLVDREPDADKRRRCSKNLRETAA